MKSNTKNKILIGVLSILFLFSLLEVYNLSALYKDTVEFRAIMAKNVSSNFCLDLIDQASSFTSLLNFFEYISFTSLAFLIYLIYKK